MKTIKALDGYIKLPKDILILFFARIINSLGSFVFPFLTMFLTERMGMDAGMVGRFMMLTAFATALGAIIGGKLCDHVGRKKIMITFQFMAAVMLIPCGFLENSMIVPWLLTLSNFFNGAVQPASSAMLADLTTKENRQQAFSLLYLGINIGVAIGPIVAGFLYKNYIRWIFWGDALTTMLSLILVAFLVKETIPSAKGEIALEVSENERKEEGSLISVMLKRPALLVFSLVSSVYSFVYAQSNFCIPLQVKDIFPEEGSVIFGSLMSINAIVVVCFTVLIIALTRRNKPILNIAVSGIFYAIGFGMLYYVQSYMLFIVSTIIWTIGEILHSTNQGVYIANNTPMSHRGRINSLLPIISGIGFAIGPRIMGSYIKDKEVASAWPLVFLISLGAAVLMYGLYLKDRSRRSDSQRVKDKNIGVS
jgi:MFS family permease